MRILRILDFEELWILRIMDLRIMEHSERI